MAKKDKKSPIEIVACEEDVNLREVGWSQLFLDKVHKEYALSHKEAVLYVNAARTKFRLVTCFYGQTVLVLPPIDHNDPLSIYLKVSLFLRKFWSTGEITALLDNEHESAKTV